MGTLISERQLIHLYREIRITLCCIVLSEENSRDMRKKPAGSKNILTTKSIHIQGNRLLLTINRYEHPCEPQDLFMVM